MIKLVFTFLFYAALVGAIGVYPYFFMVWARSEHAWRGWKIWSYLPYLAFTLLLAWLWFYCIQGLVFRSNTLNYFYVISTYVAIELSLLQWRPAVKGVLTDMLALAYTYLRMGLAALHLCLLLLSPLLFLFLHVGIALFGILWKHPLLLAPAPFTDMRYRDGYYACVVRETHSLESYPDYILIAEDKLLLMKPIARVPVKSEAAYSLWVSADSVRVYWTESGTYTAVPRR